jgi:hypothetical protein
LPVERHHDHLARPRCRPWAICRLHGRCTAGRGTATVGAVAGLQQRGLAVALRACAAVYWPSGESGDRFDRGGPVDACVEKAGVRATLAQGSYDTTSATSPTFPIYLSTIQHPASPLQPQPSSAAALSHTSLRQRACRGRPLPYFALIASISLTCPHGGNQRARDAGHAHRDQGALPRPHQEVQAAAQGPRSPCASRKGSFSPPGRPG